MPRFLVMADGPDEPGIVAAVTGVLAREGCNLEDTSMTRLGGRFVMLLMVETDAHHDGDALLRALSDGTTDFALNIGIDWLADEAEPAEVVEGEEWAVSVYGADHPGIVAAIAGKLAAAGANIADLTTRVIGDPDEPVYTMLIDVVVPDGSDGAALAEELRELGEELGVTCHAEPVDADAL